MIRKLVILIAATVAFSVSGCSTPPPTQEQGILASFDAIKLILEPIVGDLAVEALLAEGVSPHAYAPRPSEMVALREAALVVSAHPYVDGWMEGLGAQAHIALFADGNQSVEGHAVGADDHDHGQGMDPHQWNDPDAVLDALPALTNALCAVMPDDCPALRRRTAVFASEVTVLKDSLQSVTPAANEAPRCFVTAQPFMDQFLMRFDIPFVGPLSVSADVEPSPTTLSRIIEEANRRECRYLVVQTAQENRLERRLAREQAWEIIEVDPLGYGAASYQHYLRDLHASLMTSSADVGGSEASSTAPMPGVSESGTPAP